MQIFIKTLRSGINLFGMASSSIFSAIEHDVLSDIEEEVQDVVSDRDVPECKSVPCHLWMTKCVSLYNDNGNLSKKGFVIVLNPIL
jgi:hypothetical protein